MLSSRALGLNPIQSELGRGRESEEIRKGRNFIGPAERFLIVPEWISVRVCRFSSNDRVLLDTLRAYAACAVSNPGSGIAPTTHTSYIPVYRLQPRRESRSEPAADQCRRT